MTLDQKRWVIGGLGFLFLLSLVSVQWLEVERRQHESGAARASVTTPAASRQCVDCHSQVSTGIVEHWTGSTHAEKGVACVDCHKAEAKDADVFSHYGQQIATIVTPRDCARCHPTEAAEFSASHHSKAGNILASLDNFLAETVEARAPFNPHSPTPGRPSGRERLAPANSGCQQCHGSLVAFQASDGGLVTMRDLSPTTRASPPTDAVGRIVRNESGKPLFSSTSWPNTGIGRLNLDGSTGSCAACHSRHDFSSRRARQPENCGKCHLGPDHPQKEIYDESKHGVAFRDLIGEMNLDAKPWVVGKDYSAAPTCATCHMSANMRNGMKITHDPGERISWTNRPPVSLVMDTDANHAVVTETDPEKAGGHCRHGRGQAQPDEAGVLDLPHTRPHQPVLPAVRRCRHQLQREVCQAGSGHHERAGDKRHAHQDPVRRENRVDVVLPLAPRRAARPHGCLDDGARLHPVARHVRGGRALLHGTHPRGA
jgi:hypothetical protein